MHAQCMLMGLNANMIMHGHLKETYNLWSYIKNQATVDIQLKTVIYL